MRAQNAKDLTYMVPARRIRINFVQLGLFL